MLTHFNHRKQNNSQTNKHTHKHIQTQTHKHTHTHTNTHLLSKESDTVSHNSREVYRLHVMAALQGEDGLTGLCSLQGQEGVYAGAWGVGGTFFSEIFC